MVSKAIVSSHQPGAGRQCRHPPVQGEVGDSSLSSLYLLFGAQAAGWTGYAATETLSQVLPPLSHRRGQASQLHGLHSAATSLARSLKVAPLWDLSLPVSSRWLWNGLSWLIPKSSASQNHRGHEACPACSTSRALLHRASALYSYGKAQVPAISTTRAWPKPVYEDQPAPLSADLVVKLPVSHTCIGHLSLLSLSHLSGRVWQRIHNMTRESKVRSELPRWIRG